MSGIVCAMMRITSFAWVEKGVETTAVQCPSDACLDCLGQLWLPSLMNLLRSTMHETLQHAD